MSTFSLADDFSLVEKAMSARSRAMSNVADGRAAFNAASFMDSIVLGDDNHELTVSAMTSGLPLYFPNPEFSTYGTFPSSWPGLRRKKIQNEYKVHTL
jgi:hypothetical protein